jgi:p-aminobenzoyl-glutamate transporter AbgT
MTFCAFLSKGSSKTPKQNRKIRVKNFLQKIEGGGTFPLPFVSFVLILIVFFAVSLHEELKNTII